MQRVVVEPVLGQHSRPEVLDQYVAALGERPGSGDDSRSYGPPFLEHADGTPSAEAGFYLSCNRNKRSITINHSTPEGADLVRALAQRSDVLIENFRGGVLKKYGLDYETLHQLNPDLVYCSITGYGQDGPYADRPGYDGVFQAMSGMMSVSGLPHGEPGAGPMKVGISIIDILTALYAGNAQRFIDLMGLKASS